MQNKNIFNSYIHIHILRYSGGTEKSYMRDFSHHSPCHLRHSLDQLMPTCAAAPREQSSRAADTAKALEAAIGEAAAFRPAVLLLRHLEALAESTCAHNPGPAATDDSRHSDRWSPSV